MVWSGRQLDDICGEFSFDLAMLFDRGELEAEGESYRPCVAFTADEETFYVQPADIEVLRVCIRRDCGGF